MFHRGLRSRFQGMTSADSLPACSTEKNRVRDQCITRLVQPGSGRQGRQRRQYRAQGILRGGHWRFMVAAGSIPFK